MQAYCMKCRTKSEMKDAKAIRGSGVTQALLTLSEQDVRRIDSRDLLTTRRLAEVT